MQGDVQQIPSVTIVRIDPATVISHTIDLATFRYELATYGVRDTDALLTMLHEGTAYTPVAAYRLRENAI